MAPDGPERAEALPDHHDEPVPDVHELEPPLGELHGAFDDPEDLDVDELENDDGWGEDDE